MVRKLLEVAMPDSSLFKSRRSRRSGVVILFTREERDELHRLAAAAGKSTADYVRSLIAREVAA